MQLLHKNTSYYCHLPAHQPLNQLLKDWVQKRQLKEKILDVLRFDSKVGYYLHEQYSPNYFMFRKGRTSAARLQALS